MTKKERLWQMFKFLCFSLSAGVIQFVSFELLALICRSVFSLTQEQYYWGCHLTALLLSVIWNFTFNRKFTFKSANNVPKAMALVLLFYAVFTPLSIWWGDALVKIGWDDTLVELFTMVINFVTEYVYDAFVVFRKNTKVEENAGDEQIAENNGENIANGDNNA